MPEMNQGVARANYFDRNGVSKVSTYQAEALVPAAPGTKWSYTVPSNKKAFSEYLHAQVRRVAAAAPVGIIYSYITFTPSGGVASFLLYIAFRKNAIGDSEEKMANGFGAMYPGDNIFCVLGDTSTGGLVDFISTLKTSEYDA